MIFQSVLDLFQSQIDFKLQEAPTFFLFTSSEALI